MRELLNMREGFALLCSRGLLQHMSAYSMPNPPRLIAITLTLLGIFSFAHFVFDSLPGVLSGQTVSDFPNYYFAGQRILEGRPLYANFAEEVRLTLGMDYQVYPADTPLTLLMLTPLALFSYPTASAVFVIISVLIIGGTVLTSARISGWNRLTTIMFVALALGCIPTLFLLLRNHMEALLMAAIYFGWMALRSKQPILGGACWGLAAAIKLFPILLLIALVRREPSSALFSAIATFICATFVGFISIGSQDTHSFIFEIMPRSEIWLGAIGNYSLLSLFSALDQFRLGILGAAVLFLAILAFLLIRPRDIDTSFGVVLCAALLISPLSWPNYLILILPLLVILPHRCKIDSRMALISYALLCLALSFTPGYIALGSGALNILVNHLPTFALFALGWWWIQSDENQNLEVVFDTITPSTH